MSGKMTIREKVLAYVLENLSTEEYAMRLTTRLCSELDLKLSSVSMVLAQLRKEGVLVARGNAKMRQYRLATDEDRRWRRRRERFIH